MVQELAKRLIRQAEELQAQDIYILPRGASYELLMRIGDDRRLIDVCESDRMANLISHFKFVAGMNVGEKDATSSVLVTTTLMALRYLYDYQLWVTIRDRRAWLFVSCIIINASSGIGLMV